MSKTHKIVVIEDALVASMASNRVFTKEFPFLAKLHGQAGAQATSGCGGCQRKRNNGRGLYNTTKTAIAGMVGDRLRKLKTLLGAEQVRITYKDRTGKAVSKLL